jgi:hypothetical protein
MLSKDVPVQACDAAKPNKHSAVGNQNKKPNHKNDRVL